MTRETERLFTGTKHRLQLRVDEHLIVPALAGAFTGFSDMPPVLATVFMVGFIEWACIESLQAALPPDFKTVGTHIDISHVAPTPVGMVVTAEVELLSITGRDLYFRVQCSDEAGLVGQGTHKRTIVESAKFLKRVAAKREKGNV
jgi:fluoroacetyl-CoA thioesterase